MRKWLLSAVIIGLLVSLPATCFASNDTSLKDLKGHWSEAQVTKAVKTGWINGYPDKTFRPENTITRAEFTKMALAADRLIPGSDNALLYETGKQQYKGDTEIAVNSEDQRTLTEYEQKPLTDMNSHWLTKQGWTNIALNYGMLVSEDYAHSGYRFDPDKPITRYEMAIIMDRMLGLVNPSMYDHSGEDTGFTDDGNMKDWQKGYVIEARKAGVLQGYPDGSFHGERTATRAEAVTMVQNALDYMEKGIDKDITVKVIHHNYSGDWEQNVPEAMVQSVDGILYIPADRCHAVDYFYTDRGVDYASGSYVTWAPVTQGLILNREMKSYLIFAGSQDVYSRHMYSQDSPFTLDAYSYEPVQMNTVIPPRMLYGHLMIGLKPVEKTDSNKDNCFPVENTIFWDAGAKSASMRFLPQESPRS